MFIEILIVLFLLLFFFTYGRMLYGRFTLPPGPVPLPIFGNTLQLDIHRPQNTVQEWSKQYGPVFTMWMANHPIVMVTDYELMKEAFIKHGDQFSGRPRLFAFDMFTHGNHGILFASGDLWKEQRRFSLHVLRNFGFGRNIMEEKILVEARKLSASLKEEMKSEGRVVLDLHSEFQRCSVNIISSMVVGYGFQKGDDRFNLLKRAVVDNFKLSDTIEIALVNSWPWLRHVPLFGHFGIDNLMNQEKIFREFLSSELERHKEELKNRLDKDQEPSDFVEAYLKEMKRREEAGEDMSYFSEWQLIAIGTNLYIAGMETVVTTLRWAVLAMMKYPNIQRKVFDEINKVLGRERSPSLADRQALPYVMATVTEVQRWGNTVPINFAHMGETDFELGGYKIPKNVEIIPQISALPIDEKIFPSPEKFIPERFLEEDGKTFKKIEQFAPFSVGKRLCMGEGLARAELFLIFIHLIQQFEFLVPPGAPEPSTEAENYGIFPEEFETLVKLR